MWCHVNPAATNGIRYDLNTCRGLCLLWFKDVLDSLQLLKGILAGFFLSTADGQLLIDALL